MIRNLAGNQRVNQRILILGQSNGSGMMVDRRIRVAVFQARPKTSPNEEQGYERQPTILFE
ncbi:MAG: hypothetical protein HY220_03675 [Candidatus Sungbacteria bacterium]|uniref:Uncharacterized protein n=1 Tax=Candidatus Sungiibacteriota bacterium TaxID=2750080 RepID=A0A9D6LNX5_9BACT|nr:hypothetical protein [Candidatus Sungbacteria bacterium]